MKRTWTAIAGAVFLWGCAHQKSVKSISSSPSDLVIPNTPASNAPVSETPQKISLPYVFVRHGVEIRVISVEFSPDQAFFLVNAMLQEKRGHAVKISPNF